MRERVMVRVAAGYIVDEEPLVAYLESVGYGPASCRDPPEDIQDLDFSDVLCGWFNWHTFLPNKALVPGPNCILEGENWFPLFVTRITVEHAAPNIVLHETPRDREIRDRFIAATDNELDASSMHFMNRPPRALRCHLTLVDD